jgi:NADH dehydrogenase
LKHETLELAGAEVTTTGDVIERLAAITGRNVAPLPVPSWLAALGVRAAEVASLEKLLGFKVPLNEAKLTMLLEENVVEPPEANALPRLLGTRPTTLDEGLRKLADQIPEQLPSEGVGPLVRKRFRADIRGGRHTPTALLEEFRRRVTEVMPLEFSAEPGAPRVIEEGATLTLALPLRGNVQVRVEEVAPRRVTLATVEGHMLAGVVQFSAGGDRGSGVRFTVEIHARPATTFDWLVVNTLGDSMQQSNWEQVVGRVVELSGGTAARGVESETATLTDEEARRVVRKLTSLVNRRKRAQHEPSSKGARPRPPAAKGPRTSAKRGARTAAGEDVLQTTVEAVSKLAASALKAAAKAARNAQRASARKAARKSPKTRR